MGFFKKYKCLFSCCRKCWLPNSLNWKVLNVMMFRITSVNSVQCAVYSLQRTVYTLQCTVWSIQFTVWSVLRRVHSVQCAVSSLKCTLLSYQCTVHCSVPPHLKQERSLQRPRNYLLHIPVKLSSLYTIHYQIVNLQCTVCSAQCTGYTVYSVQYTHCTISRSPPHRYFDPSSE